MKVTVLTASLPQRAEMLAEARASVKAQTHSAMDVQHLVGIDDEREGAGVVLNDLLTMATGEWLMVLDDDDLLDPEHIATALAMAEGFDVVYTMPRVEGGTFGQYHIPFDARYLERGINVVSHTALVRTSMVKAIGGWHNVRGFDLDLFQRLSLAGARFRQVPEVTWTYRLHGSNWSHGTLEGAAL